MLRFLRINILVDEVQGIIQNLQPAAEADADCVKNEQNCLPEGSNKRIKIN